MSGAPLALGLVGCGRLAEAGYLPALRAAAGVRLVAVADPDPGRRERLAGLASGTGGGTVAAFPDAAALLAGADVEGLVLATPVATHLDDAVLAAAAGVPVLVEKPPAADATGAAALAAVSPQPWVGFNRRFDPGARAVRDAVPATGPIELDLEIRYRRRSWDAHAVRDDALLDLGPHLVDWARWLSSSEVVEVACSALRPERLVMDVTLARGGRATIRAATDRPHAEIVQLRDGSGRPLARHRLGGVAAAVRGRLRGVGPSALVTSLAGQLDAFAAAVRGEAATSLGTATDGHAVMIVIDAARDSAARGGRPAPVPRPVEK